MGLQKPQMLKCEDGTGSSAASSPALGTPATSPSRTAHLSTAEEDTKALHQHVPMSQGQSRGQTTPAGASEVGSLAAGRWRSTKEILLGGGSHPRSHGATAAAR